MRIRNPDPDGHPQEMVIPDKPELIRRMIDQRGWVVVEPEPDADDAEEP